MKVKATPSRRHRPASFLRVSLPYQPVARKLLQEVFFEPGEPPPLPPRCGGCQSLCHP